MRRGEIRWYTFRAPDKRRPVLLLTRDSVLGQLNEIIVAPLTRTGRTENGGHRRWDLFTGEGVWNGGFYELALEYMRGSTPALVDGLSAIWGPGQMWRTAARILVCTLFTPIVTT